MNLLEKQLIVKASRVPEWGMGLFTKKFIAKGTRIVEYKGRITTWKQVKNDSENEYMYAISNARVIDAKRRRKAFARYANDACGIKRIRGLANNCVYVHDKGKVFIQSIRDIAAGSEILVSYGKEYWDVRKANMEIDRIEERRKVG